MNLSKRNFIKALAVLPFAPLGISLEWSKLLPIENIRNDIPINAGEELAQVRKLFFYKYSNKEEEKDLTNLAPLFNQITTEGEATFYLNSNDYFVRQVAGIQNHGHHYIDQLGNYRTYEPKEEVYIVEDIFDVSKSEPASQKFLQMARGAADLSKKVVVSVHTDHFTNEVESLLQGFHELILEV